MTEFRIDMLSLLERTLGTQGLTYYRIKDRQMEDTTPRLNEITVMESESDGMGLLGLPVYGNIVFPTPGDRSYTGMTLMGCLTTLHLPKNIITTPVAGRNGEIKEFIANGDYQITIQGILVNDAVRNNRPPQEKIRLLRELVELPQALPVESRMFEWHNIHNLVIVDYKTPPAPGFVNIQPFELNCISDDPIEIEQLKDAEING